ncbi:MAG: phage portal protein [Nanoarchaeota archaeon]
MNTANVSSVAMGNILARPTDYARTIEIIRNSPELFGIFNGIITDLFSDGVIFVPYKKQGAKTNISKAEEFFENNFVKEEMEYGGFDWLGLGNALFWKGNSDEEAKKFKEFILKQKGMIETKELNLEVKQFLDEVETGDRMIKHVPWSTITIEMNKERTGIGAYIQSLGLSSLLLDQRGRAMPNRTSFSGIQTRKWLPSQVIHAKFMEFNGSVYGYTPTFTLLNELQTLKNIKDYASYYFQNGGVPDFMFIFKEEDADSVNVRAAKQNMEKYKTPEGRHGNMFITGDVEAKELNQFNKDMEFRKLAVYFTANVANAFNVPRGKIQSILGLETKGGGTDDLEDSSYWRRISRGQDYWENIFNTQLFIPMFGVKMKINRSYKQDEVREAQTLSMKVPTLMQMQNLYSPYNKKLSINKINELLGVKDDDLAEGKVETFSQGANQQLPNNELNRDSQSFPDKKRNEQNKKIDSAGKKPEGN